MSAANTNTPPLQARDFKLVAKKRLLERDMTVTALAERLGLARNTVSMAINHPTMLPTVKRRIAAHLRLR